MKIAKVIIEYNVFSIDKVYDYLIPTTLTVVKGTRVMLSFGNNKDVMAYVLEVEKTTKTKAQLEQEYGFELKYIKTVIDEQSLLDDELTKLAFFMKEEYFATLISCFQTMLPRSLKPRSGARVKNKKVSYLIISENKNFKLTSKQEILYNLIKNKKELLKTKVPFSASVVKALIDKKAVEVIEKEVYRQLEIDKDKRYEQDYTLNSDQQKVLDTILSLKDETLLLEGVTGSGKSEVYLHLVMHHLSKGEGVILLVPEIILTSQLAARFKFYFKDRLALLHSALSDGEKYDEYRRIKKGEARIVIGTRSAIFAPIQNLGLIIIDEEHSTSYKQESMPCYHTLEIATFRARYHKINLLLGSATPSVETKARAVTNVYKQLNLPTRINNLSLPDCEIIDMKNEENKIISQYLKDSIKIRLAKNEQVILLINRRGYAPYVKCGLCGYVFKCDKCNVSYNYHKSSDSLKCHYCGKQTALPNKCPICNSKYIEKGGFGTQKIEEIIKQEFKDARVIRMDSDSTSNKKAYSQMIDKVVNNKVDIIIGTQMVSKGLNFPLVTLVGVLNADLGLNASDFRASERVFQLLVQVMGRAGRKDRLGEAIIQTYQTDNQTLLAAASQDYQAFFLDEIKFRRLMNYPPFRLISYIELRAANFYELNEAANIAKKYLSQFVSSEFSVLGPSMPYLSKIGVNYRMKIMLKYKNKSKTIEIINDLRIYLSKYKKVRIIINVDPYSDL